MAWFVPDMEKAAAAFEQLGFFLTPYVAHQNLDATTGVTQPFGTGNRCAMLERGYLEVLAAVQGADTELARQQRAAVTRYTGVHLIAFSVADADAAFTHLAAEGFEPAEPVHLRRPIRNAAGENQSASFTVLRAPPGKMPEGRIQILTQETPDVVWQPQLIARDNHIAALSSVLLCVDDPGEAAARYGRFTGRKPEPEYDARFAALLLDRGSLAFATPERCHALLPGVHVPETPAMVAVGLLADDVQLARAFYVERGIRPLFDVGDRFCISPADAHGAALIVHSDGIAWPQIADSP